MKKNYSELLQEKKSLEVKITPKIARITEIEEQIKKIQKKCKHINRKNAESKLVSRPYGEKKFETICPDCGLLSYSDYPLGKTLDSPGAFRK